MLVEIPSGAVLCDYCALWARWRTDAAIPVCDAHRPAEDGPQRLTDGPWIESQLFPWAEDWDQP